MKYKSLESFSCMKMFQDKFWIRNIEPIISKFQWVLNFSKCFYLYWYYCSLRYIMSNDLIEERNSDISKFTFLGNLNLIIRFAWRGRVIKFCRVNRFLVGVSSPILFSIVSYSCRHHNFVFWFECESYESRSVLRKPTILPLSPSSTYMTWLYRCNSINSAAPKFSQYTIYISNES